MDRAYARRRIDELREEISTLREAHRRRISTGAEEYADAVAEHVRPLIETLAEYAPPRSRRARPPRWETDLRNGWVAVYSSDDASEPELVRDADGRTVYHVGWEDSIEAEKLLLAAARIHAHADEFVRARRYVETHELAEEIDRLLETRRKLRDSLEALPAPAPNPLPFSAEPVGEGSAEAVDGERTGAELVALNMLLNETDVDEVWEYLADNFSLSPSTIDEIVAITRDELDPARAGHRPR